MSKLDPRLRHLAGEPDRVRLFVKFTGPIQPLLALGLIAPTVATHATKGYSIAAGTMPPQRLEELAALDNVVRVEGARRLRPTLNNSLPAINVPPLHGGNPPFTGKGAIIGIVDTGLDYRHLNFRNNDAAKTTRVLSIWDQSLKPKAGEAAPPEFPDLGVEYSKTQIDAALATATPANPRKPLDLVRSEDTNGHGTFVTNAAAGNGLQAGFCHGVGVFKGVAPEADIIMVKFEAEDDPDLQQRKHIGDSVQVIHAVDYILKRAGTRPVVVNISLGSNQGGHNGTSLLEENIEAFLSGKKSRAVVTGAGNSANDDKHTTGTVAPGGTTQFRFDVDPDTHFEEEIDIVYSSGDLNVSIKPAGTTKTFGPVGPGDQFDEKVDPSLPETHVTRILIDTTRPRHIHIVLLTQGVAKLKAGCWTVTLANPGTTATTFHSWVDGQLSFRSIDPNAEPKKLHACATQATIDATINIPGTSLPIITVGAYDVATDEIAPFSSRGPTSTGDLKPDVVAPGVGMTSARTNALDEISKKSSYKWCCDCCFDFYTKNQGTSFSAPLVSGVVALMFQKNPDLTATQILTHLKATAGSPPLNPQVLPNNTFGHGVVNALAAVQAVPAPAGGGGSGGGNIAANSAPGWPLEADWFPLRLAATLTSMARHAAFQGPASQLAAALVSRHFGEVRTLINHNRRVATLWRRCEGPGLARMLLLTLSGARISPMSPDARRAARTRQFLRLLARYGTPPLRQDVESFGDGLLALAVPQRLPAAVSLVAMGASL